MNSLEWGPCGRAPCDLNRPTAAEDPNADPAGHGNDTTPANNTGAGFVPGPQVPAAAAAQREAGADPDGGAVVPSQGKKRRRRAPRVGQETELLPPSTTTAVMATSPHLVDWYTASFRQGAEYYIQGVRLLAEKNALDLQRLAMTKYVWTAARPGGGGVVEE